MRIQNLYLIRNEFISIKIFIVLCLSRLYSRAAIAHRISRYSTANDITSNTTKVFRWTLSYRENLWESAHFHKYKNIISEPFISLPNMKQSITNLFYPPLPFSSAFAAFLWHRKWSRNHHKPEEKE